MLNKNGRKEERTEKKMDEKIDKIELREFNFYGNRVCFFLLPVALFAYLVANIISTISALPSTKIVLFYGAYRRASKCLLISFMLVYASIERRAYTFYICP